MVTDGAVAEGLEFILQTARVVQAFATFTLDYRDSYAAHDLGAVDLAGQRLFWKFAKRARDLRSGSEIPADPGVTTRVLTTTPPSSLDREQVSGSRHMDLTTVQSLSPKMRILSSDRLRQTDEIACAVPAVCSYCVRNDLGCPQASRSSPEAQTTSSGCFRNIMTYLCATSSLSDLQINH